MVTGWRLAGTRFSTSHEEMFSGEGAALFGGRWNSKGTRVVYLGTSLAQAAYELLMHLTRDEVLVTYAHCAVSFDEALIDHIDVADLPDDWMTPRMARPIQTVGDEWVRSGTSLVLQVPSAALVGEFNFLLNPHHPDVDKLEFGPILPFRFDPRTLK